MTVSSQDMPVKVATLHLSCKAVHFVSKVLLNVAEIVERQNILGQLTRPLSKKSDLFTILNQLLLRQLLIL